jgi:hypothetical protein
MIFKVSATSALEKTKENDKVTKKHKITKKEKIFVLPKRKKLFLGEKAKLMEEIKGEIEDIGLFKKEGTEEDSLNKKKKMTEIKYFDKVTGNILSFAFFKLLLVFN